MAKATIVKKIEFEAAHYLPKGSYRGKCNDMHGHSYKCEIGVSGLIDPHTGMVMDFSVLNNSIKKCIKHLDHKLLNDIIINPTVENIIMWIWKYLAKEELIFNLSFITIWETSNCYCTINAKDIANEYYDWVEEIE